MTSYHALAEVYEWLISEAKLDPAVVATDASEAMVRRTAELAEEFRAPVRTVRADWQELPGHFDDDTFDMVFCVGNSLHQVGLRTERTTDNPEAENYLVVASKV